MNTASKKYNQSQATYSWKYDERDFTNLYKKQDWSSWLNLNL